MSKSLIGFDRGSNRYAVHELLRQYAEAELATEAGRFEATVKEHAQYFEDRSGIAAQYLTSGEQQTGLRFVTWPSGARVVWVSAGPDRSTSPF